LEAISDKPIKELNLSDNALGPTAAPGYELFFQKNKTLEKLYLNNCGMGPIGTPNLIKIIIENKDMPLKVLKIARNKMETVGCNSISELIKNKKTLQEIKISDNEIDSEALKNLYESIKINENITLLDINNNTFKSEGTVLSELITNLKNIVHLNISDLTIGNRNIIKNIFEELPKLNNLREFFFEYNISDIDFEKDKDKIDFLSELLECLLKVNNLKEVHLENNDFPKDLYKKYLPLFKNKGIYLFSCFSEDEQSEDLEDEN
jgi:Ran GTPase-activating protein 1